MYKELLEEIVAQYNKDSEIKATYEEIKIDVPEKIRIPKDAFGVHYILAFPAVGRVFRWFSAFAGEDDPEKREKARRRFLIMAFNELVSIPKTMEERIRDRDNDPLFQANAARHL